MKSWQRDQRNLATKGSARFYFFDICIFVLVKENLIEQTWLLRALGLAQKGAIVNLYPYDRCPVVWMLAQRVCQPDKKNTCVWFKPDRGNEVGVWCVMKPSTAGRWWLLAISFLAHLHTALLATVLNIEMCRITKWQPKMWFVLSSKTLDHPLLSLSVHPYIVRASICGFSCQLHCF